MPNSNENICAVTGTGGYLGSRVKTALERRGGRVISLTRNPTASGLAKKFALGDDVAPDVFARARALVHCAYDFRQIAWTDIQRVNVAGSEKILRAAKAARIENIVFISSISAFEGCRSLYGRAKLRIEKVAHSLGAVVIRPGLIYGDPPEGMFGQLVSQVDHARLLPLVGGGAQIQFLIHERDLTAFICDCVEGKVSPPAKPITVANETPWTFRQILEAIAAAKGKKISFIPVPWRLVWAGIRGAELCRVPLNFRSDSLVSLIHQNPNPSFAEQRELKLLPRAFDWTSR